MKPKPYFWESKTWYHEKRKRFFRAILTYSILFFPLLAAQIGILVFDIVFFSAPLYQALVPLIFIGHILFLMIFLPFAAMWLMFVIKFRSTKKKLARGEYSLPELEEKILLFLIKNKGKSFTAIEIQHSTHNEGPMEELNAILSHLIITDKLKVGSEGLTANYSINLK